MRPALLLWQKAAKTEFLVRGFASGQVIYNKPGVETPSVSTAKIPDVPGLSHAVLTTNEPVGPGAAKSADYKVPEYFNYNKNSYFEAEVEMAKYRCPQPSAVTK